MEAIKQFPKEYSKSFQPSFDLLKIFNIRYLQDDESIMKQYWHFLYIIPAVLIHLGSLSTHIAVLLQRDQMMDVAYMLPPFLVCLHSSLKAVVVVPRTSEISLIITELGGLWRTKLNKKQSAVKNKILKRLHICNSANYWVGILGTLQYLVSPLFETLFRRYVLHQECEFLLPIAASFPFDPHQNWLLYIVVYIFQCYIMCILVCLYVGSELIMVTLCALLGAEFIILKYDLAQAKPTRNKITDSTENDGYTINDFVKRHQKLIVLSRQLDNVFNRLVFIDLLLVGITTCAFNFAGQFARGPTYTINNYIAVAANLCAVLFLCYYGELLMGASARLGDVAYQNLWYKGDSHYKKAIWLIIKISQRPCCLTSLRYAVVSLQLFTKVMSTTWSYFSLMNSVYNVEENKELEY